VRGICASEHEGILPRVEPQKPNSHEDNLMKLDYARPGLRRHSLSSIIPGVFGILVGLFSIICLWAGVVDIYLLIHDKGLTPNRDRDVHDMRGPFCDCHILRRGEFSVVPSGMAFSKDAAEVRRAVMDSRVNRKKVKQLADSMSAEDAHFLFSIMEYIGFDAGASKDRLMEVVQRSYDGVRGRKISEILNRLHVEEIVWLFENYHEMKRRK
jgi:hypothetical protein